ncbi:MAG TPA: hypothetical protein VKU40_09430 [Thermoanaerobaculia bacterium]|nr:hypothetical protein [Thermoanaerobaculia bacterium]
MRDDTRHEWVRRPAEAALARWLDAESAAGEAAAEAAADEAFAALFADALPAERVPAGLSTRLTAVADAAAAERSGARRSLFGLRRRWVERLAAGLLLAAGLSAAGVQLLFSETAGPALSRMTPGQVLSTAAEGVYAFFRSLGEAFDAAANTFETLTQLSGAMATVAGTAPVAIALGIGLLLASFAFRMLKDLLARERGLTHAEHD